MVTAHSVPTPHGLTAGSTDLETSLDPAIKPREVGYEEKPEPLPLMLIRELGLQPYELVWEKMKRFTLERTENTIDELWLLEHPPVYTQGQAGKAEHLLRPNLIPVIQTDRGGQITYHGPGQLIAYTLINLSKKQLGIRSFVCALEQILINLLQEYQITAARRSGAPGVYVEDKKIASIGLRVKQGCAYHGIALNVDLDLTPFQAINPCGYQQLEMTQLKTFVPDIRIPSVEKRFIEHFIQVFGITNSSSTKITSCNEF